MIDTYQPPRQKHPRRENRQEAGLQRILFALIALCLVGISIVALVLAREYLGNTRPAPLPTLTPVTSLTPTPTNFSPTPSPTTSTPALTPMPSTPLPPGCAGAHAVIVKTKVGGECSARIMWHDTGKNVGTAGVGGV